MSAADAFKRKIDSTIQKSFAVAVKGQTFPLLTNAVTRTATVTVIEASSWAFANCFEIERKLRKFKKDWYVDNRIAEHLNITQPSQKQSLRLFPRNEPRTIHLYEGYLWNGD
jgi:hypothetical protein